MKKIIVFCAIIAIAAPSAVFGGKKAKLGPCVRDCIHAFNPSLADSGADEFVIQDFEQEDCVAWCQEQTEYGDCGFWTDGCCHTDFPTYDPDCGELPAGNECTDDVQCASDVCDIVAGETVGVCSGVTVNTVTSAGQVWMDRNLGASRVATSLTDSEGYGDLYQWGRLSDGHEQRTSPTTTTLSPTDVPGHGSFILASSSSSYDWRSPQNDNLWQGVAGINNPCPPGFRLPTDVELDTERVSWSSQDYNGAFASPLKLVPAGYRNHLDGTLSYAGSLGYYWSSTVNNINSHYLFFYSYNAYMYSYNRALGFGVRCLED